MNREERLEAMEAALRQIVDWAEAYPLEVFPAPNMAADRAMLGETELSRLNAASMRHVVTGVGRIAREALQKGEVK